MASRRRSRARTLAAAAAVLLGALLLAVTPFVGRGLGVRTWADEPAVDQRLAVAERALAEGMAAEAAVGFRALLEEAVAAGSDKQALASLRRGLGKALLLAEETYASLEPLEALAHDGAPADLALYAEALLAHARRTLDEAGATSGQVAPYLEDVRRALARIPDEQAVAAGRAWLEGEEAYLGGRHAQAVELWATAPSSGDSDPQERWYRERQAHALYHLGRQREAAEVYERLGNARAAASAWAAAREGERALAHYAVLLAAAPGDPLLLEDAVSAARFTSTQTRLESILAALRSEDPTVRATWAVARSRLAQQRGDHAAAVSVLREVIPALSGPSLAHLCHELAASLLLDPSGGEKARVEAAAALLAGWAVEPGRIELAALMSLLAEQDYRAAPRQWPDRRPLERSLSLQRALASTLADDPFMQANLGNIARLAGESLEAVRALEAAVALAPADAAFKNDLGLALLAAGRTPEAEAAFRAALEDDGAFLAARQNLARLRRPYAGEAGLEARRLLLGAEAAARAAGEPSLLYRTLALRAWRYGRRAEAR